MGTDVRLKPFFTYYGGKYRIAPKYPRPKYARLVEPFAGSAGYSLRYPEKKVWLYDLNEHVIGVWDYLICASEREILRLPDQITDVRDLKIVQEAKWLIGFWCNKGSTEPRNKPSTWMKSGIRPNSQWGPAIKTRIASQLCYIRHWKCRIQSYQNITNIQATWFVDPPYSGSAGRLYTYNQIDYNELARFCEQRKGQVLVCEQQGATWLPFKPFCRAKSLEGPKGKSSLVEAIWTKG